MVGYIVAFAFGMVNFGAVSNAAVFMAPQPLPYGFEFSLGAVIAVTLVSIVSAIETVGDASATTKAGAGREATDKEIAGATYADGLGTAVAAVFGGLPNTSFSQNVGIVGMTGIMSRHVVTIGALFLILCGLIPKIGAVIASMPLPVLGGGVIVMFGMVAAAGLNVLTEVKMNRRNMVIIAVSLAAGLGLNLVPTAVQYLPGVVAHCAGGDCAEPGAARRDLAPGVNGVGASAPRPSAAPRGVFGQKKQGACPASFFVAR